MMMMRALCLSLLVLASSIVFAGGSFYNVTPGTLPKLEGKVDEWPVPTPKFARDPAPAPDGSIFITVMFGDKIARFDSASKSFREWDLPKGANPHGLLVDKQGIVWYTGHGNGTIGRLDPATGKVTQYKAPSGGDPHTIVQAPDGTLWFTVQSDRIGKLDPLSGKITEYPAQGGPYGITLDRAGNVWFCALRGNRVVRLDPKTGNMKELAVEAGSGPRRIATAPDGSLWVTLYYANKLAHIDPDAQKVIKEYPLPAGPKGGAYAVTVDGGGYVWANEINSDTVVRLDPKSEHMETIKLPTPNTGIRKMIIAADGRLWYMGSHSGKLGVIE